MSQEFQPPQDRLPSNDTIQNFSPTNPPPGQVFAFSVLVGHKLISFFRSENGEPYLLDEFIRIINFVNDQAKQNATENLEQN